MYHIRAIVAGTAFAHSAVSMPTANPEHYGLSERDVACNNTVSKGITICSDATKNATCATANPLLYGENDWSCVNNSHSIPFTHSSIILFKAPTDGRCYLHQFLCVNGTFAAGNPDSTLLKESPDGKAAIGPALKTDAFVGFSYYSCWKNGVL